MSSINIINISSQHQLFDELNRWVNSANMGEYLFLMTSASWCGPCKLLKEQFKKCTSDKVLPILYVDIDDDEFADFVTVYGINTIPTGFVLTRNTEDMVDCQLANVMDISRMIEERISGAKLDEYKKYM